MTEACACDLSRTRSGRPNDPVPSSNAPENVAPRLPPLRKSGERGTTAARWRRRVPRSLSALPPEEGRQRGSPARANPSSTRPLASACSASDRAHQPTVRSGK